MSWTLWRCIMEKEVSLIFLWRVFICVCFSRQCCWPHTENSASGQQLKSHFSSCILFVKKYSFGCVGLSCGTRDISLWHARWVAHGMWDLVPWPGIEPKSPASEGGLLTPGPPRKSVSSFILGLAAWRLLHTRIVGSSGELGSICKISGFLSFLLFFFRIPHSFSVAVVAPNLATYQNCFFYQSFSCFTCCVSELEQIGLLGNQTTFVFISTCGFDLGCCQQAELLIFTSL